MKKQELIEMLNRDIAEEHAAILRYLVHGYMEGEGTSLGSSLISISREEMWHMHWLGMIIARLGGEPNFIPSVYPFDPTNRATILKSYVDYEENLVPHYSSEAEKVDDPDIKRILRREGWESAIHAKKFQRKLEKLNPEEANGLPGSKGELPKKILDTLQAEVTSKYNEMLQHIRNAWIFQKKDVLGWKLMDQSMEKMKQLAHFAEPIAEDGGVSPQLKVSEFAATAEVGMALGKAIDDLRLSLECHMKLREDVDITKRSGLVINLDLTIQQEQHQKEELRDLLLKRK